MIKFALRVLLACVAMFGIIVAMHVFMVVKLQPEVDEVYRIQPGQNVLVISSSELGCAITEAPEFHNKMIWVSDTSVASQLMRLKELERRGQLSNAKILMLPFNYTILTAQRTTTDMWAWYQELAVSWRYLGDLPCSRIAFVRYILSNLRFPMLIHVRDAPPERNPLSDRPAPWRENFIRTQCVPQRGSAVAGLAPGWDARLFDVYSEIASICRRHSIRLVFVQAPILPQYDACQSDETLRVRDVWIGKLKGLGADYLVVREKFDERDFFDTRHLVKPSSLRFTRALCRELRGRSNEK